MGGTVGFVDNAPHGTVMTLRLPAVQQSCGVTVTSEATSEATSGQTSAADAGAAAAAAAESACDYADMLRDKRILVSVSFCTFKIDTVTRLLTLQSAQFCHRAVQRLDTLPLHCSQAALLYIAGAH
jgi:hypothetical protein